MNVRYSISESELAKYNEYAYTLRFENPCNYKCDDADRRACCGCPEQREFCERLEEIGVDEKEYRDSLPIKEFVELGIEREELIKKIESLQDELHKISRKRASLALEFDILDDNGDVAI